jgi:hypothetical protein
MKIKPKKAYAIIDKIKKVIDPMEIYIDENVRVSDDEIIVRVVISAEDK